MSSPKSSDFRSEVHRLIEERNRRQIRSKFLSWRREMERVPRELELKLPFGWEAGLELQPLRWMNHGLELLKCSRGTATVKSFDGSDGPYLDSYLPYSVFQAGAECFFKGMWLCQFEECRALAHDGYLARNRREELLKCLKGELGHDLLGCIEANRRITKYERSAPVLRFLNAVEGVIRSFYFPLYVADRKENHWANSRYPKRFYNDTTGEGTADMLRSFPPQDLVVGLFQEAERRLDRLWRITSKLAAASKTHIKS